jgi:uncharacterized membrane-anchored protein
MYFDVVKIIKKIVFLLYNVQTFNFIIINVNLPPIWLLVVGCRLLAIRQESGNLFKSIVSTT